VYIELCDKSRRILDSQPSLLQSDFVERFSELKDWEQSLLLSSLQRIAELMNVEDLKVEPHLFTGTVINASEDS
jgi:hypothetical protein